MKLMKLCIDDQKYIINASICIILLQPISVQPCWPRTAEVHTSLFYTFLMHTVHRMRQSIFILVPLRAYKSNIAIAQQVYFYLRRKATVKSCSGGKHYISLPNKLLPRLSRCNNKLLDVR